MIRRLTLLVMLALPASLATATTVVPQTIEQLTKASTVVVSAHAQRSWVSWDAQHHLIFTYTVLAVTKTLAGPAMDQVLVRQMGGSLDGITQKVSGVQHLQRDQDAVLFLHPAVPDGSGAFVITGLMQGQFQYVRTSQGVHLTNGVMASSTRDTVQALTTRGYASFHGTTIVPDELEARVRDAAREGMRQQ
ncbi:MAG: hypothetical protein NVS9B15_24230 [Acidobacteriaceae bacterium]